MQPIPGQLRHDLRGAAVNINGFHGECALAAAELRQTLEPHLDGLPATVRATLLQLIDDDLLACLGLLGTSIEQLEGVIERSGGEGGSCDMSSRADHAD